MPFIIFLDKETGIIHGKIKGKTDNLVLRKYALEMDKVISAENKKLILSDYREAFFSFSVLELFHLPEKHNLLLESLGKNIHALKRALLVSKSDDEMANFFEDVAVNRGQNVKVFTDEEEAINWLQQK